ncbi:MAG: polymer-forming cytoskeletal protein [bacterium]|nr:polymer-forming cytoskeletal protein [Gammaproteobacteria bacterium]
MKFSRTKSYFRELTTYIGKGARFTGEITGEGNFVISGRIDADCVVKGSVNVTIDGYCKGTINATNVVIAGGVEGDINATDRIEVTASANVTGKLCAKFVAVAEGALIDGSINVTGSKDVLTFSQEQRKNQELNSPVSEIQSDAVS